MVVGLVLFQTKETEKSRGSLLRLFFILAQRLLNKAAYRQSLTVSRLPSVAYPSVAYPSVAYR